MNDDVFSNLMGVVGLALLQRYISEFMFNGVNTLGTKGFLDYFPEYNMSDGSISKQRSVLGRSYEQRPWDSSGHFNPVL
jgi:phytochromobilin:ferredoxin oxidoreductase